MPKVKNRDSDLPDGLLHYISSFFSILRFYISRVYVHDSFMGSVVSYAREMWNGKIGNENNKERCKGINYKTWKAT